MRSCCRIRRWSRATCIAVAGGHDVAGLSDVRAWNRRATPTPTPKPTELLTLVRPPLLPPLLRLQHQHRHRHQHQHHHQDQHQHHFGADLIRERGYPKPSPLPNLYATVAWVVACPEFLYFRSYPDLQCQSLCEIQCQSHRWRHSECQNQFERQRQRQYQYQCPPWSG